MYSLGGLEELPALILLGGVRVLATQVLGDLTRGKLRLTHVAEVARQVDRLACRRRYTFVSWIHMDHAMSVEQGWYEIGQ